VGIGELRQVSIDEALVPESAFDWLCQESARLRKSGAPLVHVQGRQWLRLDNYVGVIETPCGIQIEILPKHVDSQTDAVSGRRLLRRMLTKIWGLPKRETTPAGIEAFHAPLTEWVMREFVEHLDHLVKRGVRFDYHAVREQQRFLRGRLLVEQQMRQPPGREHIFCIEHDVFDADRPENRLLRSALDKVCRVTREPGNWRRSHELASCLATVPLSQNVDADFRRWRDDRLMSHYRTIRPWCELILTGRNPLAVAGGWRGLSLLFPMEKLFERYVEVMLRSQLTTGLLLTRTPSRANLCEHLGSGWFNLQPDLMVSTGNQRWILDTKWKRLDEAKNNRRDKYDVRQADMYQLFAYGHKYLPGRGDVVLVYPATATFTQPLPVFTLADELRLWVLPFDLESGRVVGLERAGIAIQDANIALGALSA
jgi:5-methylcytosine-specific restriction enzyme subunit McrC